MNGWRGWRPACRRRRGKGAGPMRRSELIRGPYLAGEKQQSRQAGWKRDHNHLMVARAKHKEKSNNPGRRDGKGAVPYSVQRLPGLRRGRAAMPVSGVGRQAGAGASLPAFAGKRKSLYSHLNATILGGRGRFGDRRRREGTTPPDVGGERPFGGRLEAQNATISPSTGRCEIVASGGYPLSVVGARRACASCRGRKEVEADSRAISCRRKATIPVGGMETRSARGCPSAAAAPRGEKQQSR